MPAKLMLIWFFDESFVAIQKAFDGDRKSSWFMTVSVTSNNNSLRFSQRSFRWSYHHSWLRKAYEKGHGLASPCAKFHAMQFLSLRILKIRGVSSQSTSFKWTRITHFCCFSEYSNRNVFTGIYEIILWLLLSVSAISRYFENIAL